MCEGQYRDLGQVAKLPPSGKRNYCRAILSTFLVTREMLVVPKVSVGNDQTRFRPGDRHRSG
jgi:hypothetical protein